MRLSPYSTELPAAARYTAAVRALGPGDQTAVLAYHPVARMNPFQQLLYSASSRNGVAAVGAPKLEDLLDLASARTMGARTIAHLHWTSAITGRAQSKEEAEVAVDEFHDMLDQLKAEDTSVVWTIHNRLPHMCLWPEAETRLRAGLAARADAIHLMNLQTVELVADVVDVPRDKTFVAPHPSYLGAYPRTFDRINTRLELGLRPGQFVVGLVGSIQPYKGVDDLLDVIPSIKPRIEGFHAVVAGIPGTDPESLRLVDRLATSEAVTAFPEKLGDNALARILTAVDVVVLPYRASLNSGAALLAMTFGVPIVGPANGPFLPLIDAGFALGYDPTDSDGLYNALLAAPEFVEKLDSEAMAEYVESLEGSKVSDQFFKGLWSMIGDS